MEAGTIRIRRPANPAPSLALGRLRVTVDGDEIVGVDGHPDDPAPSPLLDNFLDGIRSDARVRRPAVRRGWLENGPGPDDRRGADEFVELDWAEALDLVAAELQRVRAQHGNESIYGGSYGWGSAGRFHHAQSQLHRFLNCIGGYTKSVNTYSSGASEVILPHVVGVDGMLEVYYRGTTWNAILEHTELLVAFGGMNLKNAAVSSGGIAHHCCRRGLSEAGRRGLAFELFSPLRTDLPARRVGHVARRPCPAPTPPSCSALAHVLVTEGLHDPTFLDRYSVGADRAHRLCAG